MSTRVCAVDGCAGLVQARGLCAAHYTRRRRYGDVSYLKRPAPVAGRLCGVEGCGRRHHAGGMCKPHYKLARYVPKPRPRRPEPPEKARTNFGADRPQSSKKTTWDQRDPRRKTRRGIGIPDRPAPAQPAQRPVPGMGPIGRFRGDPEGWARLLAQAEANFARPMSNELLCRLLDDIHRKAKHSAAHKRDGARDAA